MKNPRIQFFKKDAVNKGLPALREQAGFTLVESLVAILILVLTMGALFSLASGGIFSARYARNQIVANNLLQEAVEVVRNSRDTAAQSGGYAWDLWLANYNVNESGELQDPGDLSFGCFDSDGCMIDPYDTDEPIRACGQECSNIVYYPDPGFYAYEGTYNGVSPEDSYETSYRRKIRFVPVTGNPDQYMVTAEISWLNGSTTRTLTQSILLTNWRP